MLRSPQGSLSFYNVGRGGQEALAQTGANGARTLDTNAVQLALPLSILELGGSASRDRSDEVSATELLGGSASPY